MTKSFLSYQTKEIILGSLLGDGSLKIHKPYKNARFSFRHSIHQKEYFWWKVNKLKEISGQQSVWRQRADGFGGEKLRYQSLALESLTELFNLTHEHGRLRIRRKWLNMLTPLSLAIWWMDDGSLIVNSRRGVFCTDNFDYKGVKLLSRYLRVVWKINTHVGRISKVGKRSTQYRIWLRSSGELQKFLRIILPYMPLFMLSKAALLYKDSQLQQRWISEVRRLTGFSRAKIEKVVAQKKSKWVAFRE